MPGLMWWFVAMVACTSNSGPFDGSVGTQSVTFADPELSQTGASPVVQLWRTAGRYTLPDTTLPEGFTHQSRFPVQMTRRAGRKRKASHFWQGVSPFSENIRGRVGPPPGMSVYVGDEKLRFSNNLGSRTWRIDGERLVVAWPEDTVPRVTVEYAAAADTLKRREPSAFEGEASEFVQYEITVDRRTRAGLLLPAPTTAQWQVTLPEGARFEGWPSIAPVPIRSLSSDGATVRLVIVSEGERAVAGERFLKGAARFEPWRVDLSAWSGRTVDLILETEVYGTRDFDAVFVGSPAVWGDRSDRPRRVVVIGLDTTRPDHFGFFGYDRPTTPELDQVLSTSTVFDHAWTPAPRTRPSFRSATTGRSPLDAVGAKNIGEVFQENGFATAGIVANVHLQPRFDFNHGFDDWWFDGQADAGKQVDRALDFLSRYPDRDAYVFLHIMDPHLLYRPERRFEREFVRQADPTLPASFNRWQVYQWERNGELDERRKQHIRDLYDAELRGMSEQLGRLYDQLDRMDGRTLVVIHNDHGEEFWEHGGFEHNHTLYDDVTRAILAFRSGAGQREGRRLPVPVTLADIAPTLYAFAGFDDLPPTDGRDLSRLLLSPDDPDTPEWSERPIGVAHLRYGFERWGVVFRNKKYVLHTDSGQEELYDLGADPSEQNDLTATTDLTPWRAALSEAHDMPVGRGWRMRWLIRSPDRRPFEMSLPSRASAAGVVDPEAATASPANQAWGESPKVTPEDIGTVALSEDGTTLTFTPAASGAVNGTVYVLFHTDVDPALISVTRQGEGQVVLASGGNATWRSGNDRLRIEPGTVLVPPPSEAQRIRVLQGDTEAAGSNLQELIKLGYIEDDTEEEPEAPAGSKGDAPQP
ncbi:MAG: sulfatase [Myxococcales bacterium]|nr:sulfatase [Myxococcales bacterium]